MTTRVLAAGRVAAAIIATVLAVTLLSGCSEPRTVPAQSGDRLEPGTTYSADLDGDGDVEHILVEGGPASLTITDGDTVYHSRDRWQVAEAHLGDTDLDGLPEVVTLLDSDEGRHLGLFAYFGGAYRERLVTSALTPRPLSLEVVSDGRIVLAEAPPAGQSGAQTTIYTWNGFGFTAVQP